MKNKFFLGFALSLCLVPVYSSAEATEITPYTNWTGAYATVPFELTISFTTIDLPDINPGEDLWQYNYYFCDTTHWDQFTGIDPGSTPVSTSDDFHIGDILALVFKDSSSLQPPPLLYENITPITNGDWSATMVNGGVDLADDNEVVWYRPLVDAPSLDGLGATFIWNGIGTPGAQAFAFGDGNTPVWTYDVYNVTTPGRCEPIPEPATLLLMGTGLVGLYGVNRRKGKKR